MTKLSSLIPTFNIFIMAPGEQEEQKPVPAPAPIIIEKGSNEKLLKALLEKKNRELEKKFDVLNKNIQSVGRQRREPNHSMLTQMLQTQTTTLSELMSKLRNMPTTSHAGGG